MHGKEVFIPELVFCFSSGVTLAADRLHEMPGRFSPRDPGRSRLRTPGRPPRGNRVKAVFTARMIYKNQALPIGDTFDSP